MSWLARMRIHQTQDLAILSDLLIQVPRPASCLRVLSSGRNIIGSRFLSGDPNKDKEPQYLP